MIGGAIFTLYEIVQMKYDGAFKYLKSYWNWPDLIGLSVFWIFAANALQTTDKKDFRSASQVYLMTIIIMYMFLKVCFFIRIYSIF